MVLGRASTATRLWNPDALLAWFGGTSMVTSTPRLGLALAVAWLLLGSRAHGQTDANGEVVISTDRPAVSNSSVVVPRGSLEIENGFLATDTDGAYLADFPESNVRYGLLGKTELRLSVPDYFLHLPSGSGTTSGFGDLALGVKQQVGPFGGFDLSAIVFVSFPTGASGVSSGGYDPGLQLPWSYKVSAKWTAGGQVAFYWPTLAQQHNFTGETAFFLDRQFGKPWDAFMEYAGDFPDRGGSRQVLHFGTAYKLTPHQQIDFHVAVGISGAAAKNYIGIGYSVLFLPR